MIDRIDGYLTEHGLKQKWEAIDDEMRRAWAGIIEEEMLRPSLARDPEVQLFDAEMVVESIDRRHWDPEDAPPPPVVKFRLWGQAVRRIGGVMLEGTLHMEEDLEISSALRRFHHNLLRGEAIPLRINLGEFLDGGFVQL